MTKLTPFDSELIVMVRNLTGKDPDIKENEDNYTMTVDVSGKSNDEKKAIDDAICGRIYPRLILAGYTQYEAGKIEYGIMYNADFENIPAEYRGDMETPGYMNVGKRFCRQIKEVFAILVDRQYVKELVEFCGNGIVEIPRTPHGALKFTFANANGIFQTAYEMQFICTTDGKNFEILGNSEFARMYEPKGENIPDFLNEKFGTDIYMRCKKLNEEVNELFDVVKRSGVQVLTNLEHNIDFIDELADVSIVLNHIAALAGFTNAELEKLAFDKIQNREIDPDFARQHPHAETADIPEEVKRVADAVAKAGGNCTIKFVKVDPPQRKRKNHKKKNHGKATNV